MKNYLFFICQSDGFFNKFDLPCYVLCIKLNEMLLVICNEEKKELIHAM